VRIPMDSAGRNICEQPFRARERRLGADPFWPNPMTP
jgi:hypothetical protein